jgi:hypothetical protein
VAVGNARGGFAENDADEWFRGLEWRQNALAADNSRMSTWLWILVAVLAVGTIVGGLLRIRAWLQSPAPPEVIEAAHRRDEEKD